jgi:hypothetical protein
MRIRNLDRGVAAQVAFETHVEPTFDIFTLVSVSLRHTKNEFPNPQLVSKFLYGVRTRLGYGKDRTCSGSASCETRI